MSGEKKVRELTPDDVEYLLKGVEKIIDICDAYYVGSRNGHAQFGIFLDCFFLRIRRNWNNEYCLMVKMSDDNGSLSVAEILNRDWDVLKRFYNLLLRHCSCGSSRSETYDERFTAMMARLRTQKSPQARGEEG